MKTYLFSFTLLAFLIISCDKETDTPDIINDCPDPVEETNCMEEIISDFMDESICPTGIFVSTYLFQGDTVKVLNQGFCVADYASPVYSSDCELLGYLGGFIGNTIINGEDFSNAVSI